MYQNGCLLVPVYWHGNVAEPCTWTEIFSGSAVISIGGSAAVAVEKNINVSTLAIQFI